MKLALRNTTDSVSGGTLALSMLRGRKLEVQLSGHDVTVIGADDTPAERIRTRRECRHLDVDFYAAGRRRGQRLFGLRVLLDRERGDARGLRKGQRDRGRHLGYNSPLLRIGGFQMRMGVRADCREDEANTGCEIKFFHRSTPNDAEDSVQKKNSTPATPRWPAAGSPASRARVAEPANFRS